MKTLSKVLVSLSMDEDPKEILSTLELLCIDNKTQIYLLHIIEEMPRLSFYADAYAIWEEFRDQAIKQTLSGMEDYLKVLSKTYKNIEVVVEAGAAAIKIVDKADELDCDLIIAGTHTRKGISHLIHSNIAEHIIRNTKRNFFSFHIEKD